MIQANELRIGNLIDYKSKLISINGMPSEQGVFYSPNKLCDYCEKIAYIKDCKPVILSEEILLKLSFWSTSNSFDYSLDGLNLGYITNDEYFQFEICGNVIDIKYLHQLQNLYFALTGSELNTSGL